MRWMVSPSDMDKNIMLLENFTFIDKKGLTWMAPKGEPIDGATIPKMLWPVAGSSFVGDCHRASVIHDIYYYPYYRHLASSKDMRKVFYEACLTDGVKPWKAGLVYEAIKIGGPKWQ
eukprot:CAMPEP_0195290248 /NCGR_PEP_ID=MMETSP0707-20130614/6188_1 /TAXON_ID=33640 /ORGANISM="Asterionellopsis glacialis, Strain CCMP134" /LENGTH=116 /DNA_ID=CAMNT_0040350349 /DNA_START=222 /DNA_END=572 /DNA_ORIENTATION=+